MEHAGSEGNVVKEKFPQHGPLQWPMMYCREVVGDHICNTGFRTVSGIKQHMRRTRHLSAMSAIEALLQPQLDEEDIVGEGDQLSLADIASSHGREFSRWKEHLGHRQSQPMPMHDLHGMSDRRDGAEAPDNLNTGVHLEPKEAGDMAFDDSSADFDFPNGEYGRFNIEDTGDSDTDYRGDAVEDRSVADGYAGMQLPRHDDDGNDDVWDMVLDPDRSDHGTNTVSDHSKGIAEGVGKLDTKEMGAQASAGGDGMLDEDERECTNFISNSHCALRKMLTCVLRIFGRRFSGSILGCKG